MTKQEITAKIKEAEDTLKSLREQKVSPLRHRRARAQVMVKFNSIQ